MKLLVVGLRHRSSYRSSAFKIYLNEIDPSRKLALIQSTFSYFMIVLEYRSMLRDVSQICHYILHHTYTFTQFQSIEKRILRVYECVLICIYIYCKRDKIHLSFSKVCAEKKKPTYIVYHIQIELI